MSFFVVFVYPVDFSNVDRHLALGRPEAARAKIRYQGDADALPWHKTLLSRNAKDSPLKKSQISQNDPSVVPITAWKTACWWQYSGAKMGTPDVSRWAAYLGLSKKKRLTACRKIDPGLSCPIQGTPMKSTAAGLKMLDKTEQSDRAPNPNEKPESCYCSALPKAYPATRDGWPAGARKQSGLAGMLTLGR